MNRIFGLDLVRCIAILSVLVCHTMVFLYPFTSGITEVLFNLSSWSAGFYGVEIFFILSGFLIGNIFIRNVVFNNSGVAHRFLIGDFWMRRWVRTLPNYFLFLLINFLLIWLAPDTAIGDSSLVEYVFFFHYIFPNSSAFFGVSWSLAVEEWFYFLLPILFTLSLVLIRQRNRAFLLAMLLLLIVPTLLKVVYAASQPLYGNTESVFHYQTFYKLDSIFYGVLLAWLWNNGTAYKWLHQKKNFLFFIGSVGMVASLLYAALFVVKPVQHSVLMILFAPVTSISIALVFPFLYHWKVTENGFTRAVTFISLISYSLYLVHVPLINIYKYCSRVYSFPSDFYTSFAAFITLNLASVFIAFIIYRKFELPVLTARDRIGKFLAGRNVES